MESSSEGGSSDYWLRWQVPVCALIFIIPAVVAVFIINRVHREPIRSTDLWVPCWRNLNPIWLLVYRAFAFASMVFVFYQTLSAFGMFSLYFYTQWTFVLVITYFALGTGISAYGCWMYKTNLLAESEDSGKFLKRDSKEIEHESSTTSYSEEVSKDSIRVKVQHQLGLWGNLMLIVYQTCAGAVMLTDVVFWCILLPFMTNDNFKKTLLIVALHSMNVLFLLLDSALNKLPFSFHGMVYFVLWSVCYILFQWILHACGVTWWPYPFLELSNPRAPLWYFGIALVHVPCYGIYALLIKAKGFIFTRLVPRAFVRSF